MATIWRLNITRPLFSGLLCLLLLSFQPADNYRLIKSIALNGTQLSTDKFGNVYLTNKKYELLKIDRDGNNKYRFNEISFGPITAVDVSNPLRVLVFYQSFSTVIFLDQTLSEKARLPLLNAGFNRISAFCSSMDNTIWIYDEIEFRLKKVDEKLEVTLSSEDLSIILGEVIHPVFMLEKDNLLYVSDPEKGIYVFDLFGNYYKTISLKGIASFQKFKDQLYYFKDGALQSYHLKTFQQETLALPAAGTVAENARLEPERLFVLRKNQLDLYAY